MEVYLIPVGADRYELYCEIPDELLQEPGEPDPSTPEESDSSFRAILARRLGIVAFKEWCRRMAANFRAMLAEAERERRQAHAGVHHGTERRGWLRRMKDQALRWTAERIAEQRLLWALRNETEVALYHPDDINAATAHGRVRALLQRDAVRHRNWLIVHSLGFAASILTMPIPGPNLIAYYFAFRLIGHYLSRRGALQGLQMPWDGHPTAALTELREASALEPDVREIHVRDVASRLHLQHLAAFFKRTALYSGN